MRKIPIIHKELKVMLMLVKRKNLLLRIWIHKGEQSSSHISDSLLSFIRIHFSREVHLTEWKNFIFSLLQIHVIHKHTVTQCENSELEENVSRRCATQLHSLFLCHVTIFPSMCFILSLFRHFWQCNYSWNREEKYIKLSKNWNPTWYSVSKPRHLKKIYLLQVDWF